jgi:hypothetical protein
MSNQSEQGAEVGPERAPEHVPAESGDNLQVVKKICSATARTGAPCRAAPRIGSTLCIYHDPDFVEERRYHAARGGRKSRPAPTVDFPDIPFALQDRASLQAVLDAVLRLQLFGKIPLNRSAHILRTLSLAVHSFDRPSGCSQ